MTTTTDPTEHPPAIARLLRHFDFAHLPPHLAVVSERFHAAALVLAARDSWVANEVAQLANHLRSWPGPESEEAQRKLEQLRGRIADHGQPRRCGWWGLLRWLRLLLEAKDCAVRAVLELQRDMAPEVAEALRDLPETADSVAGLPERLAVLAKAGAVAEVTEPDSQGYATARVTTLGRHMVAIARATAPKTPAREPEPSEPPPEGMLPVEALNGLMAVEPSACPPAIPGPYTPRGLLGALHGKEGSVVLDALALRHLLVSAAEAIAATAPEGWTPKPGDRALLTVEVVVGFQEPSGRFAVTPSDDARDGWWVTASDLRPVLELGAVADQVEAAAALRTDSLDEIEQAHVDAKRRAEGALAVLMDSEAIRTMIASLK